MIPTLQAGGQAAPFNGATAVAAVPGNDASGTIQVVIALPELKPSERLVLAAAARSAGQRTQEYGRAAIRAIAPDGTTVRLGTDSLRIGLTFAPGDGGRALSLVESMLARPAFLPEALQADAAAASGRPGSPWDAALGVPVAPLRTVTPEEARRVWSQYVRPERMALGFSSASLASAWEGRRIAWPPADPRYDALSEREPARIGAARVGRLAGPLLPPGAELGPTLLSLTALGAGKGSLGWRTLRLERGRSYRVEAGLVGVVGGWRGRVAFDLAPEDDARGAREALLAAVEGLTEGDLARAKGYLASALRGEAYDAVLLPGGRGIGGSAADRAYLAAYLKAKGAPAPPAVPEGETLEELKAGCRSFLASATAEE